MRRPGTIFEAEHHPHPRYTGETRRAHGRPGDGAGGQADGREDGPLRPGALTPSRLQHGRPSDTARHHREFHFPQREGGDYAKRAKAKGHSDLRK